MPLKSIRRVSLAAALLASVSVPALAEPIETVVVTVERHAEDLQRVPESVATLSDDALASIFQSGQDIRALASRVPSLYAESSNGRVAPRFYIRGLGNTDFDLAASQPVSIIEDNIVLENIVLKSAPLYDIASVEIDRGPQGTLFGRNTTAGIIKFTTVKPNDVFDAYASASYGELGTANVEGAVGGPITDTLSVRASALYQHRDDYIDNTFLGVKDALGGYDERAARVQVEWKPLDNLSVLVNVHGRSLEGTAAIFRGNVLTKGSNSLNASYVFDQVAYNGGFYVPTDENPQSYDGIGTSGEITYETNGVKITSITGYESTHGFSRGDIDGTSTQFNDTQDNVDYLHQFTQELHIATTDTGPLFWQVGAFYFSTKYEVQTNPFFTPMPTFVRQSNTSWAVFGQASYQLTDALKVTGGIRWTSDVKALTADGNGFNPNLPILAPVKLNGNNISWDVSAAYALDEDINLYGRIATGFRAPSIQGRDLAFFGEPSIARSETITSYEAGIKMLLADHTLRLNLDGFTYYLAHPQFSAIGGVGNTIRLINARGGLAYGVEADAEWTPDENWVFTAGFSYNHTEIRDATLKYIPCAGGPAVPLASLMCTPTDPYTLATGTVSLDGNPFPQAPEYIANVSAKYTWPLDNGGEIYAYTDWYVQGYTNFLLYETKEFFSDGNYEGGLRIGYILPNKNWEFALYARNITDQQNLQGAIDFANLTGYVGDPRVIGAQVTAHFH
ncbi:MAG: TonB-dependent receptor [Rhizomicrobium sp.]